ncbi:hypothetical protein OG599_18890 [Streptomyces sp. NBC_01335]|uniref:hypothetical protein n=1 Tax=Streptomyces sp. NBC_01335 TaxID=2903828 RepID=UPI002E0DF382|nr:hypothetical protein OG599_18890 [Streptomyces sp. NBC_01335]
MNLMAACRKLGATEVLGPGDAGHARHVHCARPRWTPPGTPKPGTTEARRTEARTGELPDRASALGWTTRISRHRGSDVDQPSPPQ